MTEISASNLGQDKLSFSVFDNKTLEVDDSRPEIVAISIANTNSGVRSDNSSVQLAKVGDNITVAFTLNKPVTQPNLSMSFGGVAAQGILPTPIDDNLSDPGKNWKTIYTIHTGDNGTLNYRFSGTDPVGNSLRIETSKVVEIHSSDLSQDELGFSIYDSKTIQADTLSPTISNIGLASNNRMSAFYVSTGDNLTLDFTTSESVETATSKISGNSATVSSLPATKLDQAGKIWRASVQVDNDPAKWGSQENGEAVDFIITAKDFAGNSSTRECRSYNTWCGHSITVDIKTPQISNVSLSLDKTYPIAKAQDSVKLEFDVSDSSDPFVVINGMSRQKRRVRRIGSSITPFQSTDPRCPRYLSQPAVNLIQAVRLALPWTLMVPISFLILRSMSFTESRVTTSALSLELMDHQESRVRAS